MIRARFTVNDQDYRPVVWPIPHPYWCSGYTENRAVLVAYADDLAQVLHQWPDAENIDVMEDGLTEYTFTTRFAKPSWLEAKQSGGEG